MRALQYFLSEAGASLWRGRRAAALAVLTIAAGLFVLGLFLAINGNLQRIVGRWTESAELSVYLDEGVTRDQLRTIDELIAGSGLAAERRYISRDEAAARFREDFPDLAEAADRLGSNPFPASFDVRLDARAGSAGAAVDNLAATLEGLAGVADVRYDRRWLARLNAVIRGVRAAGFIVIVVLAVASALTIANVVRLAAAARQAEIEIMTLVGAPIAYVRGPFIVEGILQGGMGAMLALGFLWALFAGVRVRYGQVATEALGVGALNFLPWELSLGLVAGGMLLGCLGGLVVARGVR